eukprot:272981_1
MSLLSKVPRRHRYLIYGRLRKLEHVYGLTLPSEIKAMTVMFYHIFECFKPDSSLTLNDTNTRVTLYRRYETTTVTAYGSTIIQLKQHQRYIWRFRICSRPDSIRPPLRAFRIGIAPVNQNNSKLIYEGNFNTNIVIAMELQCSFTKSSKSSKYGTLRFCVDGRKTDVMKVMIFDKIGIHVKYEMIVKLTSGFGGDCSSIELLDYFENH